MLLQSLTHGLKHLCRPSPLILRRPMPGQIADRREQRPPNRCAPISAAVSMQRTRCSRERSRTAFSGLMGLIPAGKIEQTVHSISFAANALRIASAGSAAGSNMGISKPPKPIARTLGRRLKCRSSNMPVQANPLTPNFIIRLPGNR
jgi:hypothetical protein